MPRGLRVLAPLTGPLTVVLFGCGLLFGDLLGTSNYPPADASTAVLRRYLTQNGGDVRALAFFHTLAALALVVFAINLAVRLERAAPGCPGRHRAVLAGGILGAGFLLLSALCYRTLADPAVYADPGAAQAVLVLSYLAGGPALAAPLAVLEAGASTTFAQGVLLPRWLGWLGLVAALFSLVSVAYLLASLDNGSWLYAVLLLGALLGFVWLVLTGGLLAVRALRG